MTAEAWIGLLMLGVLVVGLWLERGFDQFEANVLERADDEETLP